MTDRGNDFDAVIAGSGYSGSMLAAVLARQGRRVLVIDRDQHPRFAIGESTTPIADFLLDGLASRWGVPELQFMADYGRWKRNLPHLPCGLKRGFSYYRHFAGQRFWDDAQHSNSLLVAASSADKWSDTHWYRSSVDHYIAGVAVQAGSELREKTELQGAVFDEERQQWRLSLHAMAGADASSGICHARWLIDASGSGEVVSKLVGNPRNDQWMQTRTEAVWGHYANVPGFHGPAAVDDPFAGDDSAQHHVLSDRWCWMLRMENGVTSVGVVRPVEDECSGRESFRKSEPAELVADYPSLSEMLNAATRVAPATGPGYSGRLSRCRNSGCGPGWILLPSSFGFVDPLHSTGIAHSISGVMRVAEALLSEPEDCRSLLDCYARDLPQEIRWIDQLVSCCYRSMRYFDSFTASCSLYFLAAIGFERSLAASGAAESTAWQAGFLQCHDQDLQTIAAEVSARSLGLCSVSAAAAFAEFVRQNISSLDKVGLLDPGHGNRLWHTATPWQSGAIDSDECAE